MSWSAYPTRMIRDVYRSGDHMVLTHLDDNDALFAVFAKAAQELQGKVSNVDYCLVEGSLGSKATSHALETATKAGAFDCDWFPDKVKALAASADWSFPVAAADEGSKLSAQIFLNICAEHGLGIHFC